MISLNQLTKKGVLKKADLNLTFHEDEITKYLLGKYQKIKNKRRENFINPRNYILD
ncbi:MAG: hypothetical protein PVJ67_00440 [Candidatus Pacearchaeota archaeon]|jgi:hypothetical protein